jgi:hypothetical protein
MRRHYVKVPPLIQQWFPGGAPQNWQQIAFDDATEMSRLAQRWLPVPRALHPYPDARFAAHHPR